MRRNRTRNNIEMLEPRLLLSTTYYVSTSGSDSAAGTNAAPFLTLQKAANAVRPGDSVVVRAGTYRGFDLENNGNGLRVTGEANRISFLADPGTVINQPAVGDPQGAGITINWSDGGGDNRLCPVTVQGFTIDGTSGNLGDDGVYSNRCDGFDAINNTVLKCNGQGIFVRYGQNPLIQGNVCHNDGSVNTMHGIYVTDSISGAIIRGNTLYSNAGSGLHTNGDQSSGGDNSGMISNAIIEGNLIHDNGSNEINSDGLRNSIVRNNVIYDPVGPALHIFTVTSSSDSGGNSIYNNTIYSGANQTCIELQSAPNTTVFNNILFGTNLQYTQEVVDNTSLNTLKSDYNLYTDGHLFDGGVSMTLAQWQSTYHLDAHSKIIASNNLAAVFTNSATHDYHLISTAVAVDAGTSAYNSISANTTDFDGNARPQGAAYDMGAYEYAQATTVPSAPSGLSASPVDPLSIVMSWTDNSGNETGFKIERSTDGVNFSQIATVGSNVVTYTDSGLTTGVTYTYRVRATNSVGDSAYSNTASAVGPAAPTPPAAPSGLSAAAASTTKINLSWTDNASNETGFLIERSTDNVTFTQIATVATGVVTYSNTGLTAGTLYYYRVRATNSAGNSAYSNTASATTQSAIPAAPSGLTATAASASKITLNWTDNSSNETGFLVERSTDGVNFTQIASVGAGVVTYGNTGLTASTHYTYRVRATNASGNSAYSNTAAATTLATPPAAPSSLTGASISTSQVNLAWTDNSSNETGFLVERSTDGVNFTQIAATGANITAFNDTGLTAATQYTYRVRATNSAGNSAYSNTATATTQSVTPTPPATPSGLTATAISSAQVNLTWIDNSNNETGFKVERSTDGVNFSQIALVGAGITSYASTGLAASTTYTYRVRATNTGGDSGYSANASATTAAPAVTAPTAPSGLAATAVSPVQINLSWTDNSNNETGFNVERSVAGGAFVQIALVPANVATFIDSGLTPNVAYSYRVRASNSAGSSAYTSTASATTPLVVPADPTGLSATAVSNSEINLSWTDNTAGLAQFVISRQTGTDAFVQIAIVPAGTTTFSDTGLNASTQYTYFVIATDAGGDSNNSNNASATTASSTPAPAATPTTDVTLDGIKSKFLRFVDGDGTVSLITFHGGGSMVVSFQGGQVATTKSGSGTMISGSGLSIFGISATGTTARSGLIITGRGGNNIVEIGGLTINGAFGSIVGSAADLAGNLDAAGPITSLTLRSAHGGHFNVPSFGRLMIAGDMSDDLQSAGLGSVRTGSVSSGSWNVTGNVGALQVRGNVTMNLSAVSLRTFVAGGNVTHSNMTFTASAAPRVMALATFVAHGVISGSAIRSAGNVGAIQALRLDASQVYAGVNAIEAGQTLPASVADLSSANIRLIAVRTIRGTASFSNSEVAAGTITAASLGNVQTANNGAAFGMAAASIGSINAVDATTGKHFGLHKLAAGADAKAILAALGVASDDLIIRLL